MGKAKKSTEYLSMIGLDSARFLMLLGSFFAVELYAWILLMLRIPLFCGSASFGR